MSENELGVLEQIEQEVLEEEEGASGEKEVSLEKQLERKKKADALWKAVQIGMISI
ncbi:hypothetical protein [Neobacillus ginsengisoli]|uniref:Uncharacterized protein n=1 Tax=Neobacillus ginsengisoli TaxID=904295 RepID=A0ABT9XZH8_9BACI|nr:hypothetical protein [Neobacillus ginsengisoli]MDQ0200309.1 hypothetical protein [Neobacillus ginsengisoli]